MTSENRFATRLLDEKRIHALLELQKKGFLTISHIWRLCYAGKQRPAAEAAMRDLLKRGMVDRHRYFMGRGFGYQESFYFITRKGFNLLKACALPEVLESGFRYHPAPMTIANYAHRKAVLDFWASLETSLRDDAGFELAAFTPEWQADERGRRIILASVLPGGGKAFNLMPDATFIIRNTCKPQGDGFAESLFFVEIDMGTESIIGKRSLVERFAKYRQAFACQAFRQLGPDYAAFGGARLLFVAHSAARAASVARKIAVDSALERAFLFTHLDEIKDHGLLASRFLLAGGDRAVDVGGREV